MAPYDVCIDDCPAFWMQGSWNGSSDCEGDGGATLYMFIFLLSVSILVLFPGGTLLLYHTWLVFGGAPPDTGGIRPVVPDSKEVL